MDFAMNLEMVDGVLKVSGKAAENGNVKEFGRDFTLLPKKKGLEGDSIDYNVLQNAASNIKDVPGIVCEIGTRRGGSLAVIINGLLSSKDFNRNIVCIDPYGNIDYEPGELEKRENLKLDYTNDMRNEAMANIYQHIQNHPVNVVFMCMEDQEFFKRFDSGVPFYSNYKTIEEKYALVFFDGPHTIPALMKEVEFFEPRSSVGAMWVFDDLELYPHDTLEQWILDHGFVLVEKTARKASYKKI